MRTPETIATLNSLIRICRDEERLCRAWGGLAHSAPLRHLLGHRSEEWGRQGDELQALVLLLGGEPATAATVPARMQCVGLACRAAVMGRSDAPATDGCERAQQYALSCYERALGGYLPERIRRTVSLQARQIAGRCERLPQIGGHLAAP
ncbi:MAG: PA2169 family four-helix-bundle protein [Steroidobacteraceae bacterium]